MTTKANKHGLRAAAAERSSRHAQRTPLPPKRGKVADAQEVLAAVDDLTGIQAGILDAVAPIQSHGDGSDARSQGKAAAFVAKAAAAKWSTSVEATEHSVEATVTRGAETIVQAWSNGVWQYDASVYAFGDRTTKPRNASGAVKLLSRSEAEAKTEANKVQSNRHFRKAEPKDIEQTLEKAQKSLPFDPELATDEEVTGVMAGQAVVWYNRIGRSNESAIVGRKGVRITRLPDGQRVANWCCPVTGYRSCLVTAILKIGRGRSTVTAGSATEGTAKVEVS